MQAYTHTHKHIHASYKYIHIHTITRKHVIQNIHAYTIFIQTYANKYNHIHVSCSKKHTNPHNHIQMAKLESEIQSLKAENLLERKKMESQHETKIAQFHKDVQRLVKLEADNETHVAKIAQVCVYVLVCALMCMRVCVYVCIRPR